MKFRVCLSLALAVINSPSAVADTTLTIDSTSNRGTWDGWGTSLAWWAKRFGDRDDLADIFFALGSRQLGSQTLPGLGFNIVRYNAGACSWNTIDSQTAMVVSPKMMPSRQIEGFWTDWSSEDPASSSWKWSVDAKQRQMMQKARDRGANRFELFSNSPMWWMCYNHNPSGADNGGDNLQTWNFNQHAIYLATIAKYARDNWGINFESVEPFNEPMSSWWNGVSGTQEGCHVGISSQVAVISALRSELNKRGLSSIIIAASDETSYDQAVSTWQQLGATAHSNVARINVHGYQEASGSRDGLFKLAASRGQKLWNSEYGENDATGQRLVKNLILDFRWLRPTAWIYWQVLDGGGWGLIDADNENGWLGVANQKYFLLAQFTRHIRPGMRILDGGGDNVVAAYDSVNRKLIIVAANWNSAQYLNFELSRFTQKPTDGSRVLRWRSQVGSGDRYAAYPEDTAISGTRFWSWFETGTVQTFEVTNISP